MALVIFAFQLSLGCLRTDDHILDNTFFNNWFNRHLFFFISHWFIHTFCFFLQIFSLNPLHNFTLCSHLVAVLYDIIQVAVLTPCFFLKIIDIELNLITRGNSLRLSLLKYHNGGDALWVDAVIHDIVPTFEMTHLLVVVKGPLCRLSAVWVLRLWFFWSYEN